jgi:hypothetical protein
VQSRDCIGIPALQGGEDVNLLQLTLPDDDYLILTIN